MRDDQDSKYAPGVVYPDRPYVAIGAVVFKEENVLLVLRGKSPAKDTWAIPGGSINLGETLQEAAEREVREETGIIVIARDPVFTFDAIEQDPDGGIRFHYVVVDLIADYVDGDPKAGDDALDARWISPGEMSQLNMNKVTQQLLAQRFGFGK